MNINWEEDLVASPPKRTVQQGRRAAPQPQSPPSPPETPPEVPGKQPRKTGGWAVETGTIKSAKTRGTGSSNLIEQERFQIAQKSESDDDIPVIPDIEDLQDSQLHSAKSISAVSSNIMSAYKELDSELINESVFSSLGDLNLTILTKHLFLDEKIQEPDAPWDVDTLYSELVRETC